MGIHWYLVLGCFLALCLDANQDIPCPPGNELDGQHGGIQYVISNQQSFSLEFNPKNQKTFSRVLIADGNVVTYDDKEFEGRFDYDGESVNMWHLKSSHAGTYRMIDSENKCLATWTITWPDLDRITSPPGRNSTAVSPMPVSVKGQDPLDAGGSISVFTGVSVGSIVGFIVGFITCALTEVVVIILWHYIKKRQCFRARRNPSPHENGIRREEMALPVIEGTGPTGEEQCLC